MMSEHQKHTEFLRQCILYDESVRRHELAEGISRIQRDLRCVERMVRLMAILILLIVAWLGCGMILVDNFSDYMPQFIVNIICGVGLGSLISILALVGLGMVYRRQLNQRREECRQLVTKLLESRLGKPVSTSLRDNGADKGEGRTVRVAKKVDDSGVRIESSAGG